MSDQPSAGRTVAVLYALGLFATLRLQSASAGRFGLVDVPLVAGIALFVGWLERTRRRLRTRADHERRDRAEVGHRR